MYLCGFSFISFLPIGIALPCGHHVGNCAGFSVAVCVKMAAIAMASWSLRASVSVL